MSGPTLPWRLGTGWPQDAHAAYLRLLAARPVADPSLAALVSPDMPPAAGWVIEHAQAPLGSEPPGPPLPDGCFMRARRAISTYRFADPRITRGYFLAAEPLLGRTILVEVCVLGLRLLSGVRVGAVLDDTEGDAASGRSRFAVRIDSLPGHVLAGAEWVSVLKDQQTGAVTAAIDVRWRRSRLPHWWMRLGVRLVGRQMQARWRRQAFRRLRALAQGRRAGSSPA